MSKQLHPIDLLIFDVDGTLVDTRQDLSNSVNYARYKLGLTSLETAEVMQYVGEGVRRLMERSLPESLQPNVDEAISFFREHYREHCLDFSTCYPGVKETLEYFRQKRMAVISNKPEEFTRSILKGLGIDSYFALIVGGDSLSKRKPDPEPVQHVLKQLETDPERALMIGDGTTDVESGRQAGTKTCAVTYGFRSKEILQAAQPDFMIADIRELRNFVE
ncbi:phosphoglycolate phosphatase [candidate division KSB1 bacterium]|nr:phosphoglycolate phosphatase [candidate division KSB1 bacterium]NIR68738.1 phosphoglycolate phosphatase [candidate division KSB1 bacterium]NIS25555.1 phosphoglycolate phosphatase [candidate division KSB1 bacterium]NIT72448.1 phosphoglycolate phosphatase [candidate division KSB1 bacterium]NIU26232.1 phosphoglycolate phosphatase [candidate division KSB1 bacterium]